MGRPVYPHELNDSDFSWLINSFRENHPNYAVVESSCLPVVLIQEGTKKEVTTDDEVPSIHAGMSDDDIPESDVAGRK
jgi:hypothetical protein